MPDLFYTSVAKNVRHGLMVTVRGKKVVILRGMPKPGKPMGVWAKSQSLSFIDVNGERKDYEIPGGFQIKGPASVQAAPSPKRRKKDA